MVEMTFEPEMLETLAKMKGKVFKSYEGYFPGPWPVIPDKMRINLGSFAINLRCWYKEVDGCRELFDDIPCVLSCVEKRLDEPLFPDNDERYVTVLVGERVTGVSIVRYSIIEDGVLDAVIDMAVAIRTKHAVYTFSRGIWFGFLLNVAEGNDIELEYTEKKCTEDWVGDPSEGEVPEVTVTRTVIDL